MTEDAKRDTKGPGVRINLDLGNLLGPLGEALDDLLSNLAPGQDTTTEGERIFQTENGAVRAQAGVRVRAGGFAGGTEERQRPTSPKNAKRSPSQPTAAPDSAPVTLDYDLYDVEGGWMLTAVLPGVESHDLQIGGSGQRLTVSSEGARRYRAEVDLDGSFDPANVSATLRNGILELHIPRHMDREGDA